MVRHSLRYRPFIYELPLCLSHAFKSVSVRGNPFLTVKQQRFPILFKEFYASGSLNFKKTDFIAKWTLRFATFKIEIKIDRKKNEFSCKIFQVILNETSQLVFQF